MYYVSSHMGMSCSCGHFKSPTVESKTILEEEEVKRAVLVTISLLVVFGLLLTACGGQTSSKIRVATNAEFAPFEYVDENSKQIVGFDIDLINAVAKKAGYEIEVVNTGFDAMLAGLTECQYDAAIAAISITPERQAQMLFSDPYINAGQIIVVRKGDTSITSTADLAGKTVGAQTATTGADMASKMEGVTLKTYDSYELALLDLGNKQIDAVVLDYPVAIGYIAKNPDKFMTTGDVLNDENYGIAFCKDKTELQGKFNTALKELIAQGEITTLAQKWLAGGQ